MRGAVVRGLISILLEQLLPSVCLSCKTTLDENPCFVAEIPPGWPPETIDFLGADLRVALFGGVELPARVLCASCFFRLELAAPGAERVIAPFQTNQLLLETVRFLKFSGGRAAVPSLAWWMANALASRAGRETVLVNVPLHPRRKRDRGFDQAELLARDVGRRLGLPAPRGVLRRVRHTSGQRLLDRREREGNVSGAFRLERPEAVAGRDAVLVDDLVTSGATARACLAALAEAGPRSTRVLAAGTAGAPEGLI